MKKLTNKEIIYQCDQILKVFDEDCSLTDFMFRQTENEWKRLYDALRKVKAVNPDDLTAHQNDIQGLAFGIGYLFGSGHMVTSSDRTKKVVRFIRESLGYE